MTLERLRVDGVHPDDGQPPAAPDGIRRQVLTAVAEGKIPAGGPSELAARDLIDQAPDGYFERWSHDAAERIRAQARALRCSCAGGPAELEDGRCLRCYGKTGA
jgi:hypothetical protein